MRPSRAILWLLPLSVDLSTIHAQLPRWTAQRTVALNLDSLPQPHVERVDVAALSSKGRLALLSVFEAAATVLDSTGRLERTVGRAGSGPGEFRRPGSLGFLGDSLWIADNLLRRITVFDPKNDRTREMNYGLTLRSRGVSQDSGSERIRALLASRALLGEGVYKQNAEGGSGPQLYIVQAAGSVAQLGVLTDRNLQMSLAVADGASPVQVPNWLAFRDLLAMDSQGLRVGMLCWDNRSVSELPVLRMFDAGGNLIFRRQLNVAPRPVDALEMKEYEALYRGMLERPGRVPSAALQANLTEALSKTYGAGRLKPPIARMLIGSDFNIWLQLTQRGPVTANRWLILSPHDGSTIGEFMLEGSPAQILAATSSYIWVKRQDPDTELWTRIERYSILKR